MEFNSKSDDGLYQVYQVMNIEAFQIPNTFNLYLMGLRLITLIQTSLRFPDCPRLRIHNVTPIWLSEIVYCKFTNCWIMRSSSSLQTRGGPGTWQLIFHHLHNLHFFNQSGHFHPDIFMFPLPLWSRFIHVPSHWTKQSLFRTSELILDVWSNRIHQRHHPKPLSSSFFHTFDPNALTL